MSRFGLLKKVAASTMAAAALAVTIALPASAHVNLNADTTDAGSRAWLQFSFSHGCDGSATTGIAIQIPEQFSSVTPAMNHGWDAEIVTEELDEPIEDSHGNQVTERISEVVYTAKEPVPDAFYDEFYLRVNLPEDAAGETIYFPTVQTCEEGEAAWIEVPEDGADGDDLDYPAPGIDVTEAEA